MALVAQPQARETRAAKLLSLVIDQWAVPDTLRSRGTGQWSHEDKETLLPAHFSQLGPVSIPLVREKKSSTIVLQMARVKTGQISSKAMYAYKCLVGPIWLNICFSSPAHIEICPLYGSPVLANFALAYSNHTFLFV